MISARAREGQDRGRGIPLTDVERLMRHYSISEDEAIRILSQYPVNQVLPPRGTGLSGLGEITPASANLLFIAGLVLVGWILLRQVK